jgi:hypothetical protein
MHTEYIGKGLLMFNPKPVSTCYGVFEISVRKRYAK